MERNTSWVEQEQRFKAIVDPTKTLRADYSRSFSSGEHWRLAGGDKFVRTDFKIEAQRAGRAALAALKNSRDLHVQSLYLELLRSTDPRDSWLNLLRIRDVGYELGLGGMPWALPIAVNDDGSEEIIEVGSIHEVLEHSARMCNILRNEEESADLSSSVRSETAQAEVVPSPTAVSTDGSKRAGSVARRHGFEADMRRHEAISSIVGRYEAGWKVGSKVWQKDSLLKSICTDLDSDEIDVPKNWKMAMTPTLNGVALKNWCDALELGYKKLVTDQIRYSLKMARKRTTPGTEATEYSP